MSQVHMFDLSLSRYRSYNAQLRINSQTIHCYKCAEQQMPLYFSDVTLCTVGGSRNKCRFKSPNQLSCPHTQIQLPRVMCITSYRHTVHTAILQTCPNLSFSPSSFLSLLSASTSSSVFCLSACLAFSRVFVWLACLLAVSQSTHWVLSSRQT